VKTGLYHYSILLFYIVQKYFLETHSIFFEVLLPSRITGKGEDKVVPVLSMAL
jgi:hypothetical protein